MATVVDDVGAVVVVFIIAAVVVFVDVDDETKVFVLMEFCVVLS